MDVAGQARFRDCHNRSAGVYLMVRTSTMGLFSDIPLLGCLPALTHSGSFNRCSPDWIWSPSRNALSITSSAGAASRAYTDSVRWACSRGASLQSSAAGAVQCRRPQAFHSTIHLCSHPWMVPGASAGELLEPHSYLQDWRYCFGETY